MAKKFKLQTVLNYRQTLENQAQQQLAGSLQRQSLLQAELEQQRTAAQQLDAELKERQQQGLSIAEIDLFESQIQHHQRLISDLEESLVRLEKQILAERHELLGAARDKQVMEKLKEKQEAEYRRELQRKERELLDEVSLRNNKGELS